MEALLSVPNTGRKVVLVDAELASGFWFESLRTLSDTFVVLLGYDYSIVR